MSLGLESSLQAPPILPDSLSGWRAHTSSDNPQFQGKSGTEETEEQWKRCDGNDHDPFRLTCNCKSMPQITIRLTDEQHRNLQRRAKQQRMKKSAYVRARLLEEPVETVDDLCK